MYSPFITIGKLQQTDGTHLIHMDSKCELHFWCLGTVIIIHSSPLIWLLYVQYIFCILQLF